MVIFGYMLSARARGYVSVSCVKMIDFFKRRVAFTREKDISDERRDA